jgi:diaminopimelate epimerase
MSGAMRGADRSDRASQIACERPRGVVAAWAFDALGNRIVVVEVEPRWFALDEARAAAWSARARAVLGAGDGFDGAPGDQLLVCAREDGLAPGSRIAADDADASDAPCDGDGDDGTRWRVRVYNRDGSRAGMCANGVRCVVALGAREDGRERAATVEVRRPRGGDDGASDAEDVGRVVRGWAVRAAGAVMVRTEMGRAVLDAAGVPFHAAAVVGIDDGVARVDVGGEVGAHVGPSVGDTAGISTWAHAVGFGNPHAVVWAEDGLACDEVHARAAMIGPSVQATGVFPEGVNVTVASLDAAQRRAAMGTFERGTGMTDACASGACAAAVAAATRVGRGTVEAVTRGGTLVLRVGGDGNGYEVDASGPVTLRGRVDV